MDGAVRGHRWHCDVSGALQGHLRAVASVSTVRLVEHPRQRRRLRLRCAQRDELHADEPERGSAIQHRVATLHVHRDRQLQRRVGNGQRVARPGSHGLRGNDRFRRRRDRPLMECADRRDGLRVPLHTGGHGLHQLLERCGRRHVGDDYGPDRRRLLQRPAACSGDRHRRVVPDPRTACTGADHAGTCHAEDITRSQPWRHQDRLDGTCQQRAGDALRIPLQAGVRVRLGIPERLHNGDGLRQRRRLLRRDCGHHRGPAGGSVVSRPVPRLCVIFHRLQPAATQDADGQAGTAANRVLSDWWYRPGRGGPGLDTAGRRDDSALRGAAQTRSYGRMVDLDRCWRDSFAHLHRPASRHVAHI